MSTLREMFETFKKLNLLRKVFEYLKENKILILAVIFVFFVVWGLSGCQKPVQITPQNYILDKAIVTCVPYKAVQLDSSVTNKESIDVTYKCLFVYSENLTVEEYKNKLKLKEIIKQEVNQ